MKKTIGLVDVSTILHPIRLSKDNKLFGVNILTYVEHFKQKLGLDEVVLVQDYGKSRYRLDLYPEYKGNRGNKELTSQEQERLELMKAFAMNLDKFEGLWKTVKIFGVEADDILGMLYSDLKDEYEIIVLSSDKDLQNVIAHNNLYNIGKNRYFNSEDRKDLTKSQFVLLQTLSGDAIDNIKGICGLKTAIVLAQNFNNFNKMREFNGDINELIGVSPYNKRYVIKALEDIKTEEGFNQLKLNYKLISMFKDTSLLNEIELEEYTKLLAYIREDKEIEFKISDELEQFLEEYELESLYYLEEMYG